VKELRLWPILKEQLKSFQEEKVQFESSEKSITPGSIVTYRLSETERDQYEHVSKEKSYRAVRSMPQRVIKTLDKSVILTPLWYKGPERQVAISECKLLRASSPGYFADVAAKLFPKLKEELLNSTLSGISSDQASHADQQYVQDPKELVTRKRRRKSITKEVVDLSND